MELKQEFIDKVASIYTIMGAVNCIKWILMVLGGGLGAAGAAVAYKKKNTSMDLEGTPPNVPKKPAGIVPLEVQTPPRY